MSPYWAVLRARCSVLLQYRAAALAGVATQIWWGFIKIMVLEVFFRANPAASPMSYEAAIGYVWLGQAFLAMLPWNLERELADLVRSGNVAYELVRPVDLYGYWYGRVLAFRLASAALRCAPIFLFAGVVLAHTPLASWALGWPPSLAAGLAFVAAVAAAFLLSAAINTFVQITLLWTLSGEGVSRILPAFVVVFSGMVVPLPFFPDWAQPFLRALPFRSVCDVPHRLYTGDLAAAQAGPELAFTLAWTFAFVGAGRLLLSRGMRRVVVQGG
jgi:ABC-2 type transport system permease protein